VSEAGYAPCVRLPRKHPASMEAALHVLEIAVGILVVAATLGSAIKTVVITRVVFLVMRRVYLVLAPPSAPYERRDKVLPPTRP